MNQIKQKLNDSAAMRWAMLFLVATIMFATYYINDIFSGMKRIMEIQLKMSSTDYGTLLGSVGIFNMFGMIIVGGLILTKWGVRKTGIAFVGVATLGSLLIAYGGSDYFVNGGFGYQFMDSFLPQYSPQLKMMILGRLLFGLGLETCCVLVQTVIVKWFKGKELALAFAVNMGIGRLGSFFAIRLSPVLAGTMVGRLYPQFPTILWLGFGLAALAMLAFLVYTLFDIKIDKQLDEQNEVDEAAKSNAQKAEEKAVSGKAVADSKGGFMPWLRGTGLIDLMTNKSFLYITALCVTFYAAIFPFIGYASDMLVNKFGFKDTTAADITSYLPLAAIPFTIIFGLLVDKIGKSASLMVFGSLLLIFAHFTLSMTMLPPYIALSALGIAFSLVPAAMWPSVPKFIPEKRLGLAYALMFTFQNWGLSAFYFLIGKVLQVTNPGITAETIKAGGSPYNYTTAILMLAFLGLAGMLFAFLLKREDKVSGFGLELPSNAKK